MEKIGVVVVMSRTALGAALTAIVLSLPPGAAAKSWYYPLVFDRESAAPGDSVRVRTAYTPWRYAAPPKPGGADIDVYLLPARLAGRVTRDDARLVRVGRIHADLRYRGVVEFKLPRIGPGEYTTALGNPIDFVSVPADFAEAAEADGWVVPGPRTLRVVAADDGFDGRLVGLGIVFGVAAGLLGVGYRRLR